ncbi:thiamine pyrophosphokinase [Rubrolithibacter danxiaensis]|uniref:thiamine pyrophosphokinase n=1 Tax=Rubrolithibacter danxiaensis TaxID=3390805 RepID=UPI003BF7E4E1
MSSHHIVREKQEPALLIMDLQEFEYENLGQLLEWSPTVLVDETVYPLADKLGIKIDAVITSKPLTTQYHTHLIATENSPMEDGLKFLVGEQYPAVNVITREFILKDFVLFAELINVAVFTGGKKIYSIKSGFSKWQVAGQQIELLHEVYGLTTSGLRFIGQNLLETQKDGFYSLCFEQDFAFIAESV